MTDTLAYQPPPTSALEQWGRDLSTAYQIAKQLVTTSFVPSAYSNKPEQAAAAIMTGMEVGLSPLAALRSFDIIQGTPAMRAVSLRALTQSHGHEIWTEESTATRAIVCGRRKGSDKIEKSLWSIDRARDLKLTGKDNWKSQPIAMLLARATSEVVRLIAADVILGVPYSTEELDDQAEQIEALPTPIRKSRSVKRAPLPAATEEPDLDADPETGEILDPDEEPITSWTTVPIPTDDDNSPLEMFEEKEA